MELFGYWCSSTKRLVSLDEAALIIDKNESAPSLEIPLIPLYTHRSFPSGFAVFDLPKTA